MPSKSWSSTYLGVNEALTAVLRADLLGLPEATLLVEDLALDGLELTELRITCQEAFGVKIEEARWSQLATIGDVIDHMDELTGSVSREVT